MPYPAYDDFEAREIIQEEGLDYAVRHYCDASNFKNPETQKLWAAAEDAANALAKHLHVNED